MELLKNIKDLLGISDDKKSKSVAGKIPEFPDKPYSGRDVPDLDNIPPKKAMYALNWFISGGMSLEGASALVGNLWRESYLNPAQLQIINGKPVGPGRGLAQWTDSTLTKSKEDNGNQRWDEYSGPFFKMLKSSHRYWSKYDRNDVQPQLAFILYEIENKYPGVWRELTSPGSVAAKSNVVLKKYEVARDRNKPEEQNYRARLSEKVYDIAKGDKYIMSMVNKTKEKK